MIFLEITLRGDCVASNTSNPSNTLRTVEVARGTLAVSPSGIGFAEAAEAHRLIEGRQTTGKVVLLPWAE